jgi:hypothetical protein
MRAQHVAPGTGSYVVNGECMYMMPTPAEMRTAAEMSTSEMPAAMAATTEMPATVATAMTTAMTATMTATASFRKGTASDRQHGRKNNERDPDIEI